MEENSIAIMIRDGLVEKIWEGTTTILALDVLRAVKKQDTLKAFVQVRHQSGWRIQLPNTDS
jgi:hypothetical protein